MNTLGYRHYELRVVIDFNITTTTTHITSTTSTTTTTTTTTLLHGAESFLSS